MKRGDDETLSVHEQLASVGVTGDPAHADGGRFDGFPPSPWLHSQLLDREKPAGTALDQMPTRLLGAHVELPSGREHVWQTDIGAACCRGWQITPWRPGRHIRSGFRRDGVGRRPSPGRSATAVQVNALAVERPLILDGQTRVTTQLSLSQDVNRR